MQTTDTKPTAMQNAANAFMRSLKSATITDGNPCYDKAVYMECAHGYIDLRWCKITGRVSCLLEAGASMEIEGDGLSMCLNATERSTGTFQRCSGFQEAVDSLLACKGWNQ